jgi:hypothetical protein
MKLYSLALLATVAVAQTPAPKPAPQTATPTSQTLTIVGECHHYPMTDAKPANKTDCEKVGGTWVTPGWVATPTPTSNYIVAAPSRPDLTLEDALAKDGSHTVTITDFGNHWRCIITGSVPAHSGNSWHTELSSLTLVCFDTEQVSEPMPPSAKEGK